MPMRCRIYNFKIMLAPVKIKTMESVIMSHQLQVPHPRLLISIGPALTLPTLTVDLPLLAIKPVAVRQHKQRTEIKKRSNIVLTLR